MSEQKNESIVGRLLGEISWENATAYHNGGKGRENVLTAEVFQALDLLPRKYFLGPLLEQIRDVTGSSLECRSHMSKQSEHLEIDVLPFQQYYLKPEKEELNVQPDVVIESEELFVLVEAKRILPSSFQPHQLAKEFSLALREAGPRLPFLLLVLGQGPPVKIQKIGPVSIDEGIRLGLESILREIDGLSLTVEEAESLIGRSVGWLTWNTISKTISECMNSFRCKDLSIQRSVGRLAKSIVYSIEVHGRL